MERIRHLRLGLGVVPALAVLTTMPGAASAQSSPLVLAPSSRWLADFADERCTLLREFGTGADTIRLRIDSYGPGPGYRVTIAGKPIPLTTASPLDFLVVSYSPDEGKRPAMQVMAGELGGERAVSFAPGFLRHATWEEARKPGFDRSVEHVTFAFGQHRPFRLATGSMSEPFKLMDRCREDLLQSWGLDPVKHRTLSRGPLLLELPEGYQFVAVDLADKYPNPAERRLRAQARAEARMRERPVPTAGFPAPIRIMLDEQGRQTACVAQSETMSEAAREAACAKWAGPWQPAYDDEGRPIASVVQFGT